MSKWKSSRQKDQEILDRIKFFFAWMAILILGVGYADVTHKRVDAKIRQYEAAVTCGNCH